MKVDGQRTHQHDAQAGQVEIQRGVVRGEQHDHRKQRDARDDTDQG